MTERVLIVGAGHVGRGLFRAFRASGLEVLGLHGRRPSAEATSFGPLPSTITHANAVVVAVRDDQLDDVLYDIMLERGRGGRGRLQSGTVVVHTSGGAEPAMLDELLQQGVSGGTFHPLIPFAHPEKTLELLRHAWIGIDGDDQARATSRRLAGHVGARTLEIPHGGKAVYHAAAVMSSNFPVVLASLASDLLRGLGIPERSAQQAVHSLMEGAVSNLDDASPADSLTGPVARGDTAMLLRHLSALRRESEARAVYKRLSLAALEIARQRGVDAATVEEMRKALLLR